MRWDAPCRVSDAVAAGEAHMEGNTGGARVEVCPARPGRKLQCGVLHEALGFEQNAVTRIKLMCDIISTKGDTLWPQDSKK